MRLKLRLETSKVVSLNAPSGKDEDLVLNDLFQSIVEADAGYLNRIADIKAGYPPKSISLADPSATLFSLGIRNGEQVIVGGGGEETVNQDPSSSQDPSVAKPSVAKPSVAKPPPSRPVPSQNDSNLDQSVPYVRCGGGFLKLRIMEDDNSCLFRAVGYGIMQNVDSMFELRTIVANTIRDNPIEYNDAILGRKSQEYRNWILRESSWGGAIELDILSKHFDLTIASLDVSTGRIDHFNPGKQTFIVVVYSGIHYDAVALSPLEEDVSSEFDTTIFQADEIGQNVLEALEKLGTKLKQKHYYTDTGSFLIRCQICGSVLQGEKAATKHAEQTGHTDFGEVTS